MQVIITTENLKFKFFYKVLIAISLRKHISIVTGILWNLF